MAIKKLDHVSLLAKDAGPVVQFYEELLGFELAEKKELPEMGMNIYDLKARGEFIEVIEPLGAPDALRAKPKGRPEKEESRPPSGGEGKPAGGIKHVAFLSDDIEADFADFKAKGAHLLHKEVQRHGKAAFFFAGGKAGELVEVIQYAD